MAAGTSRRWMWIVAVALVLVVAGTVSYRMALHGLKSRVAKTLGPASEIRELRVGFKSVVIEGLRIRGPETWPAEDALRAERVTIALNWRSIFSGPYRIRSVTITNPYFSVMRTKSGKLLAVPNLIAGKGKENTPRSLVIISAISLENAVVEFFDETVGQPRQKIRIERIQALIKDVDAPGLSAKSSFAFTGTVKGAHSDGEVDLSGWACIATKDSSVKARLKAIELAGLQPYLAKKGDVKITGGTLDLELSSEVKDRKLRAPGTVTLTNLTLAKSGGVWGTFMGMPRGAVLSLLEDRGGKITLSFVLEGDIDNPKFSLNETFSKKLALSMADSLKTGVSSIVEGAGSMGKKGADAASSVIKGVGDAVGGMFGGGKKSSGK